MDKENIIFIQRMIFVLIIAIIMMFLFSQIHEITHVQIGKYYGCEGVIEWDFLDVNKMVVGTLNGENAAFMSTHWYNGCDMTETQILAHSINEVIGYNITPLLELILIALLILAYVVMKQKNVVIKLNKKKKGNITEVDVNKPL